MQSESRIVASDVQVLPRELWGVKKIRQRVSIVCLQRKLNNFQDVEVVQWAYAEVKLLQIYAVGPAASVCNEYKGPIFDQPLQILLYVFGSDSFRLAEVKSTRSLVETVEFPNLKLVRFDKILRISQ
ncbi:hypothetical protein DL764_010694 [Monosporascus ibericus]|uniref:Uncharacterized protein n=1 Tax=Monosporascus ibericus TaxID=155417 RepID=A0A4Q4SS81_9PEZI|nr:hypothetical protein DL764_010694 [Monosporascus ibericus]